jgi:threonine synthase
VAGTLKYRHDLPDGPVVCTLTGHGLKDPDTAVLAADLPEPIPPRLDAVLELIGWEKHFT